jgi:ABC-2 type transport system permease protein
METIKNYFFRDIGVMLGRSMLQIFRSMNAITTVAIMPIAFMLLFVYVIGGLILTLEELFFPSS